MKLALSAPNTLKVPRSVLRDTKPDESPRTVTSSILPPWTSRLSALTLRSARWLLESSLNTTFGVALEPDTRCCPYSPAATDTTCPGWARLYARWIVLHGADCVHGFESDPFAVKNKLPPGGEA